MALESRTAPGAIRAHRQGYWTGSSRPGRSFVATYGYRLPRRGDTIDQANDDGYSRLDDGRLATFWKSDPYLDPRYTHEPDARHPQWMLVDFGRALPVDALRIAWAAPYARRLRVEYFVGSDALQFANDPGGYWLPFPRASFTGHGGDPDDVSRPHATAGALRPGAARSQLAHGAPGVPRHP